MTFTDPTLDALVKGFEALQKKYAKCGARDTEPDGMFQVVLRWAVRGQPFVEAKVDWELYHDTPGAAAAAAALTAQARKVYDHVRGQGRIADQKAIESYCWRLSF